MSNFTPRQKSNQASNGHSAAPEAEEEVGEFGLDELASAMRLNFELARKTEAEYANAGIGDYGYSEGSGGLPGIRYPMNADTGLYGAGPGFQVYNPGISFPAARRAQLTRADFWAGQDELLEGLLRVKQEFTGMGLCFRPRVNKKVSTGKSSPNLGSPDLKQQLDRICLKWDWQKIVEDLLWDWFSKDTMILYWKTEMPNELTGEMPNPDYLLSRSKEETMPGVTEICALSPAECDWDNCFGQDRLRYFIPQVLKKKIQEVLQLSGERRTQAIQALILSGVQLKYIQAVNNNKDFVDLKEVDGDHWLICTRGRKRHGICKPSMYTIFAPLEMRKFITEGEFSAAILMKYLMLHATRGESITQGPLAGQRVNWAKKADITKLHQVIKDPAKATRVVTDHTVKFNFVFPPPEVWSQEKFKTCDSRIYNWAGISIVMMTGQGGTNSGGYIGIKRMISNMSNARNKIAYLIYEFFDNPQIREIVGIQDDTDVKAIFDENVLKEPRQLLEELKFLLGTGVGDPRVSLSELGRDPDTVRDSKLESLHENQLTQVWSPVYQPTSLNLTGGGTTAASKNGKRQKKQGARGRPPNAGTQVDEGTRTQSTPVS